MGSGQANAEIRADGGAPTLTCLHEAPIVAQPYTLAIRGRGDTHNLEYRQDGISNALLTPNGGRGGIGVGAIAFPANLSATQHASTENLAPAMGAKNPTAVAHAIGWDEELNASEDQSGTLLRGGDGGRHDGVMTQAMQVRRLTPVECERLQGFPDGYTQIPWRNKHASECPDGPRYKALGNSMAVPVMRWIGERVRLVSTY